MYRWGGCTDGEAVQAQGKNLHKGRTRATGRFIVIAMDSLRYAYELVAVGVEVCLQVRLACVVATTTCGRRA